MREIVDMIIAALARARNEDGSIPSIRLISEHELAVTYSDRDNHTRTFRVSVVEVA